MTTPALGSILLGTTNPHRLRDWYAAALAPGDSGEAFTEVTPTMFAGTFGDTSVLIDGRSDVAEKNPDPGRVIMRFFGTGNTQRARDIINRVLAFSETEVQALVAGLDRDFHPKHPRLFEVFAEHYAMIRGSVWKPARVSCRPPIGTIPTLISIVLSD